jgi:hypothetical protein
MGMVNATIAEMAGHFGINEKTMDRRMGMISYNAAFMDGLSDFKLTLRQLQRISAQQGNVTMLIWLGKQYLGQKDRPDSAMTGGDKLHEMLEIFRAGPVPTHPSAAAGDAAPGDQEEPPCDDEDDG